MAGGPFEASTFAFKVDRLFFTLLGLSVAMMVLLGVLVITFCVLYRRTRNAKRARHTEYDDKLEAFWILVPVIIFIGLFVWSGFIFVPLKSPPDDAMEIHVVAKQWMWMFYHPNGRRELNELHVPIDQPIKLILSSEDVIHSFYVPAFRIKQDAVPGRYTQIWFNAVYRNRFRLFCAEYCGTNHSKMGGWVYTLNQDEDQQWLASGDKEIQSLVEQGKALFTSMGCSGCHAPESNVHAPRLAGLYGNPVALRNGAVIVADEAYIRDSILQPDKRIVAGFSNDMPSFQGQVDEAELLKLISYIKSIRSGL
jgi:cytochrome c oxidase subunit 2